MSDVAQRIVDELQRQADNIWAERQAIVDRVEAQRVAVTNRWHCANLALDAAKAILKASCSAESDQPLDAVAVPSPVVATESIAAGVEADGDDAGLNGKEMPF